MYYILYIFIYTPNKVYVYIDIIYHACVYVYIVYRYEYVLCGMTRIQPLKVCETWQIQYLSDRPGQSLPIQGQPKNQYLVLNE